MPTLTEEKRKMRVDVIYVSLLLAMYNSTSVHINEKILL